jgi:hypothetical protein
MKRNFFSVDQNPQNPIPLSSESIKKIKQLKTYLEFCQNNSKTKNRNFSECIRLRENNPFYNAITVQPQRVLSVTELTNYFNKNEEIKMYFKKFANTLSVCTILHNNQIIMKIVGIKIESEARLIVNYEKKTEKNNQLKSTQIKSNSLNFTASFSEKQSVKTNENKRNENKMSLSFLLN